MNLRGQTRREFPQSVRKLAFARCRDCWSLIYRTPEYRSGHNAKMAAAREAGRLKEKDKRHDRRRRELHPEKQIAKRVVRTAIEAGKLARPSACESCQQTPRPLRDGRSGIQAHHEDYSKPLEVRWLCHACHIAEHRRAA